jgi:hypothetical protein
MPDIADDHIRKAMERGEFDNLPGEGKPLNLEHDRLVPEEYRLAYRIMRDNDVQPEWIALQKEIAVRIEKAQEGLQAAANAFQQVMTTTEGKNDLDSLRQRQTARENREYAKAEFRKSMSIVNEKIRLYNLKVPAPHLTYDLVAIEDEINKQFP